MFKHQFLCLDGGLLVDVAALTAHLNLRLCLLKHPELQTSNLVLNVLVVFLKFAVADNLRHQLL